MTGSPGHIELGPTAPTSTHSPPRWLSAPCDDKPFDHLAIQSHGLASARRKFRAFAHENNVRNVILVDGLSYTLQLTVGPEHRSIIAYSPHPRLVGDNRCDLRMVRFSGGTRVPLLARSSDLADKNELWPSLGSPAPEVTVPAFFFREWMGEDGTQVCPLL